MKTSFRWASALLLASAAATARATELEVALYPPLDESVKAALPLWEKEHPDIEIRIVSRPFGDHHKAMGKALDGGDGTPDVMGVELFFLEKLANRGLEDLSAEPYDAGALLPRFLGFTIPQAHGGTERLPYLPADVGPGTLFYRKDLLDQAGVTESDLTRTWHSFIEAGRKLRAKTGAALIPNAREVYEIYVRADLQRGEGIFFGADGRPRVESGRFRRAFELARSARNARIDAGVDLWSEEWLAGLRNGTIAAQPIGAWFAGHLERWLAPDLAGKWRAAQLPEDGFATWGGSFWAIPEGAKHKEAAWEFVRFVCLDRGAQIAVFEATDAWPALVAAQDAAWVERPIPYLGGQRARRLWKVAAASAPAIAFDERDRKAAGIVAEELTLVLEKDKDVDGALADAQRRILAAQRGEKRTAPETEPTITIAAYPSLDESVKIAKQIWEERYPRGVKIELRSLGFGDHHDAMIHALASGEDLPDVIAIDRDFVGTFAESGQLEDLGDLPYDAKPSLTDLLDYTVPLATAGPGYVAAIPADAGPGTLFYRKDLLERARVSEAELIRSWDSYIAAGKKLKRSTGAFLLTHARVIKDVYIRNGLKPGEGVFFDRGGRPLVDSPRFRRAFELARAARKAGVDAGHRVWSNEWADLLKRDEIATELNGAWLVGHMNNWLVPDMRGRWRAAALPGGAAASWGGSFYAIPKKAAHKRDAWRFIQFLCFDPDVQRANFRALDAWPVLKEVQGDSMIDEPMPFLGGQRARRVWRASAAKIAAPPPDPRDRLADRIVDEELEKVLSEGKSIARALADAKARVGELPRD